MENQKVLYIIGNGFDKYMDLATCYLDYFKAPIDGNSKHKKINKELKEKIDKKIEDIKSNIDIRENFIEVADYVSELDLFSIYLLIVSKSTEDKLWRDIESQIYPYIYEITEICNSVNSNDYSKLYEKNNDEIKRLLLRYIIEIKVNYNKNAKSKESAFDNVIKTIKPINWEYLNQILLKGLNENKPSSFELTSDYGFETYFGKYIKNINEETEEKILNNDNYKNKIYEVFDENVGNENNAYIISFNYTTYLKKIFKNMCNIHGTFDKPIFGIDYMKNYDGKFYLFNKKDINKNIFDNNLIDFTKTSRIFFNGTSEEIFKLPDKDELKKIYFMGHGLADADYSYFQALFDYYDIYNSNIIIEFLYSDFREKEKSIEEKTGEVRKDTEEKIIRLFDTYGKTLNNKDKGKNLLHKLLLENRLRMKEIGKTFNILILSDGNEAIYDTSNKLIKNIENITQIYIENGDEKNNSNNRISITNPYEKEIKRIENSEIILESNALYRKKILNYLKERKFLLDENVLKNEEKIIKLKKLSKKEILEIKNFIRILWIKNSSKYYSDILIIQDTNLISEKIIEDLEKEGFIVKEKNTNFVIFESNQFLKDRKNYIIEEIKNIFNDKK
jgi:lmo0469 protein